MNETQPISSVRAAALLSSLVPELARVTLTPQWSDGTGAVVRHTRAVPLDLAGQEIALPDKQRREVIAVLRRIGDVDLDHPQTIVVDPGDEPEPAAPAVLTLPEALGGSPWLSPDEAYAAGRTVAVPVPVSAAPQAPEMPGGAW